MESKEYFKWCPVVNSVQNIAETNSLVHTFSSTNKTRYSTKLLNKEIKKISNIKTYSQFVNCKQKILQKITENIDVTNDESDFSDSDYKRFYESFSSDKDVVSDSWFVWNCIEKNTLGETELENNNRDFYVWEPSININVSENETTKSKTSKKVPQMLSSIKKNTEDEITDTSSPLISTNSNIRNVNKSVNKVSDKNKLKKSIIKQITERQNCVPKRAVNKKNIDEIKKKTDPVIDDDSPKSYEIFEDDLSQEFIPSDFQAQSTQIFADTFSSDLNEKKNKRSSNRFGLFQNEITNQPRDSGIEEDSREENLKLPNIKENETECDENEDEHSATIKNDLKGGEKTNEKLRENTNDLNNKDSSNKQQKKLSLKIIREENVPKKYKIIKEITPIIEENETSKSKPLKISNADVKKDDVKVEYVDSQNMNISKAFEEQKEISSDNEFYDLKYESSLDLNYEEDNELVKPNNVKENSECNKNLFNQSENKEHEQSMKYILKKSKSPHLNTESSDEDNDDVTNKQNYKEKTRKKRNIILHNSSKDSVDNDLHWNDSEKGTNYNNETKSPLQFKNHNNECQLKSKIQNDNDLKNKESLQTKNSVINIKSYENEDDDETVISNTTSPLSHTSTKNEKTKKIKLKKNIRLPSSREQSLEIETQQDLANVIEKYKETKSETYIELNKDDNSEEENEISLKTQKHLHQMKKLNLFDDSEDSEMESPKIVLKNKKKKSKSSKIKENSDSKIKSSECNSNYELNETKDENKQIDSNLITDQLQNYEELKNGNEENQIKKMKRESSKIIEKNDSKIKSSECNSNYELNETKDENKQIDTNLITDQLQNYEELKNGNEENQIKKMKRESSKIIEKNDSKIKSNKCSNDHEMNDTQNANEQVDTNFITDQIQNDEESLNDDVKNDSCSYIDIKEHKVFMPDNFNETIVENKDSNLNTMNSSVYKTAKKIIKNNAKKINQESSSGSSQEIDVVHYSSEGDMTTQKRSKSPLNYHNEISNQSEYEETVNVENLSPEVEKRLQLLTRFNLFEDSEEESENELFKSAIGSSKKVNDVSKKSKYDSILNKSSINANSDENDSDRSMSPTTSRNISKFRKINLINEGNVSSSEDEEKNKNKTFANDSNNSSESESEKSNKEINNVSITNNKTNSPKKKTKTNNLSQSESEESDKEMNNVSITSNKPNSPKKKTKTNNLSQSESEESDKEMNNVSKTSNKTNSPKKKKPLHNLAESDKIVKSQLLNTPVKDSEKVFTEIDDSFEHENIMNEGKHKNKKNVVIQETQESEDNEPKVLESQNLFSSLEDLSQVINKALLSPNEDSEVDTKKVERKSQSPSLQPKEIQIGKISTISQLVEKENLLEGSFETVMTVNNFNEDEEIFLFEIPRSIFDKNVIGKKMKIVGDTFFLGNDCYTVLTKKDLSTISCAFKSEIRTNNSYEIINFPSVTTFIATQKKEKNHTHIENSHKDQIDTTSEISSIERDFKQNNNSNKSVTILQKKKKKKVINEDQRSLQIKESESATNIHGDEDIIPSSQFSDIKSRCTNKTLKKEQKKLKKKPVDENQILKKGVEKEFTDLKPQESEDLIPSSQITNISADFETNDESLTKIHKRKKKKKSEITENGLAGSTLLSSINDLSADIKSNARFPAEIPNSSQTNKNESAKSDKTLTKTDKKEIKIEKEKVLKKERKLNKNCAETSVVKNKDESAKSDKTPTKTDKKEIKIEKEKVLKKETKLNKNYAETSVVKNKDKAIFKKVSTKKNPFALENFFKDKPKKGHMTKKRKISSSLDDQNINEHINNVLTGLNNPSKKIKAQTKTDLNKNLNQEGQKIFKKESKLKIDKEIERKVKTSSKTEFANNDNNNNEKSPNKLNISSKIELKSPGLKPKEKIVKVKAKPKSKSKKLMHSSNEVNENNTLDEVLSTLTPVKDESKQLQKTITIKPKAANKKRKLETEASEDLNIAKLKKKKLKLTNKDIPSKSNKSEKNKKEATESVTKELTDFIKKAMNYNSGKCNFSTESSKYSPLSIERISSDKVKRYQSTSSSSDEDDKRCSFRVRSKSINSDGDSKEFSMNSGNFFTSPVMKKQKFNFNE